MVELETLISDARKDLLEIVLESGDSDYREDMVDIAESYTPESTEILLEMALENLGLMFDESGSDSGANCAFGFLWSAVKERIYDALMQYVDECIDEYYMSISADPDENEEDL